MKTKKNKLSKKMIAYALVVASVFMQLSGFVVNAAGENEYDVAEFKGERTQSEWLAPTEDGKVFAGWYTDTTYTTPYKKTTGTAYAKFVDAKVLAVKKQLSSTVSAESDTTNIRFITSIDSTQYAYVGFDVKVACEPEKTFDLQERHAYTSILVDGQERPETPNGLFKSDDAVYFILHSITDIPKEVFGDTFTVKPYWYTLDGTKVYGTTDTFSIASLIANELYPAAENAVVNLANPNWQSYIATNLGTGLCSYVDSATVNGVEIKNAVRVQVNGEDQMLSGFTPLKDKEYYEQYRDGKFVIEMYVASASGSAWGPEMTFTKAWPTADVKITMPQSGAFRFEMDAAMVLDVWDTFTGGSSYFAFAGGYVTADCCITGVYFEVEEPIEPAAENAVVNLADPNWQSYIATNLGTGLCSYVDSATVNGVEIKNAVRVQVNGEDQMLSGFTPLKDKEYYEQYRDGKFVIEMYVASASGSAWGPEMTFTKAWPTADVKITMPQSGAFRFEMDAAMVLDVWDTFTGGGSYFAFAGGYVTADCYITGVYFTN